MFSWIVNLNVGDDFLVFLFKKYSQKRVSDLEWLPSYDRLKLWIKGKDYWKYSGLKQKKICLINLKTKFDSMGRKLLI